MTATHSAASRGLVAVLIALFAIAWFAGIGARRLVHPDEGRYAEIARELKLTPDTVRYRIMDLESRGVVLKFHTAVDTAKLGEPVARWTA